VDFFVLKMKSELYEDLIPLRYIELSPFCN